MIAWFFALLLAPPLVQTPEAQLTVLRDERPALYLGEQLGMSVIVDVPDELADRRVALLPLGLQNLRAASMEQRVERLPNRSGRRHLFHIILEASETGAGTVDELQVELRSGDGKPQLLTWPGFSVQVSRPFRLADHWPWVTAAALLLGATIFIVLRLQRIGRPALVSAIAPDEERRAETMRELEALRVRAEWRTMVKWAFAALMREAAAARGSGGAGRLSEEDINSLAERWPDFPAAYRLGEETRYGGFEPGKREAVFITGLLRTIHHDLNETNRKESEKTA